MRLAITDHSDLDVDKSSLRDSEPILIKISLSSRRQLNLHCYNAHTQHASRSITHTTQTSLDAHVHSVQMQLL